MRTNKVLAIDSVSHRFGDHKVLDGLTLSLEAGEVFALLGANGAGKTTTLHLILGFQQADSGSVRVCDLEASQHPAAVRQSTAYLPEQVAIYPGLSGLENLRYFTLLAGLDLPDPELHGLLVEAGLDEAAHDRPGRSYSKGMRQKVGIAIALARQASLLLLDEPTSGLDPSAASEFSVLVKAAAARGMAVLMATHDLYRVREVAHRVGVLKGGKIVREVDPRAMDHLELEQMYIEQFAG